MRPLRNYQLQHPEPGLISVYNFNAGMAGVEKDRRGANDGNYTNGEWSRSEKGICYYLDGDAYCNFGDTKWGIDTTNEFSIFMRIRRESVVSGTDEIFKRGHYVYPFAVRFSGSIIVFVTRTDSGTNYLDSLTSISLNKWFDIFCVKSSDGFKAIYFDGEESGNATHTGTLNVLTGQEAFMGVDYVGGSDFSDFKISDLIIWNKVIPPGRIANFNPNQLFEKKPMFPFLYAPEGAEEGIIMPIFSQEGIHSNVFR